VFTARRWWSYSQSESKGSQKGGICPRQRERGWLCQREKGKKNKKNGRSKKVAYPEKGDDRRSKEKGDYAKEIKEGKGGRRSTYIGYLIRKGENFKGGEKREIETEGKVSQLENVCVTLGRELPRFGRALISRDLSPERTWKWERERKADRNEIPLNLLNQIWKERETDLAYIVTWKEAYKRGEVSIV